MTRNFVEDDGDLRSPQAPPQDAPPARRRWLRALAVTTAVLALGIAIASVLYPRQRNIVAAALLSYVHRDATVRAAPAPRIVRTAIVAATPGRDARFTGVVRARYESALGFRVSGKIVERLVDAGARVHKGQALMRLDPTDLALALRAAHSEVEAARAAATQTATDEVRRRVLAEKGQLSRQAYERDKAAADSAAAKLVAALAQESQTENQAAYALLLADADGVIMETSGEPGQVVAVGQSVVRLARDGAREAEVYIPEDEKPADVGAAALYAEPDTWFGVKLREISSSADPQTRTFRARYVLEGEGRKAALGTTVTIRMPRSTAGPVGVGVPAGALFDDGAGPKVWVVDRASSAVEARAVRVLHIGDEVTSIAGDLKPGERVVALGAHLLQAGETVGIDRSQTDTAAR